jgi:hypothetical protein
MKRIIVKENNGGGISIELYEDDNIQQVVTGLEFGDPLTITDIIAFGDGWIARDATNGYDLDGNTLNDLDDNGNELTAEDMVDNSEWTKEIVIYNEQSGVLTITVDELGNAGRKLLNLFDR